MQPVKSEDPDEMLCVDMGLAAIKPVFGVSIKVVFKPACSATETS